MKHRLKIIVGQRSLFSAFFALSFLWNTQLSQAQTNALGIPSSEYNALVDLYNSTSGNAWVAKSGWLNPQATYWTGVVVVQGHVNGIGIEYNNLSGTLPASLGNLPYLQSLWLFGNNLTGTIPVTLGNLAQLQDLGLNLNHLSGSIPTNLVNLTNLTLLLLEDNQLTGQIPAGLVNLPDLQQVRLSDNLLTGDVPDFRGFSQLYIDVSSNYLNILPGSPSLANLNSMINAGNTVIYAPQNYPVLGPIQLVGGVAQVGLTAELGNYKIQGSSNLVDWVNLSTMTLSNTTGQFLDSSVSTHLSQFYRAVSSP
jgi:hypothetical protein